jgi:hypothetical protein
MKYLAILILMISASNAFASEDAQAVVLFCSSQQISANIARVTLRETAFHGIQKEHVFIELGGSVEGNSAFSRFFDQSQISHQIILETKTDLSPGVFVAKVKFTSKLGDVLILPDSRATEVWMICNSYRGL